MGSGGAAIRQAQSDRVSRAWERQAECWNTARCCAMLSQQQPCKDWCGTSAGETRFFTVPTFGIAVKNKYYMNHHESS